jgi:beta-N-acetylhexosaminidase
MACLNHFPGHGDTGVDSHYFLPKVDKTREQLMETELAPYRAICPTKAAGAIMTAHILFPALEPEAIPATMSRAIMTGLLREELGFDGLIVSDGIQMKAIAEHYGVERGCIAAIRAGVDLLCVGTGGSGSQAVQRSCLEALYQAALSGEIPMERIDDAVSHVLAAKQAFCTDEPAPVPDQQAFAELNRRACRMSATWIGDCREPLSGRILCTSAPVRELAFGLTHADPRSQSFAECAGQYLQTDYAALDRIDPEGDYDTLVIGLTKLTETSPELAAAAKAMEAGKKVAFVLLGSPYGAELLPGDCPAVCIYSQTPPAVATAMDVLCGKLIPGGKLPVTL